MGKAAGLRIGGFVEVFVLRVFVVRFGLLACLLGYVCLRGWGVVWLGCGTGCAGRHGGAMLVCTWGIT